MKIYAYKNKSGELRKASSGGAFSRIVSTVVSDLDIEYSIYGAVWTETLEVEHKRVDDIKKISIFYGSKYLKSNIGGIYQLVEEDLYANKYVIFSGTPCQINGLRQYLKNKNLSDERVFMIDIICHGSPKPIVWKDCKEWLEKKFKQRITDITFRDKSIGWKRYPTKIILENGRVIRWKYLTQIYIRMFFSLLIIDKGCFSCPFSNMNRISDITIGDFWGIEEAIPSFERRGGVSIILSNTQKGEKVCKLIEKSISGNEIIEEYTGDIFVVRKYQHNLNYPTQMPNKYGEFWEDYRTMSFSDIIKKYKFISVKGKIRFYLKAILIKFKFFDERLS